MVMAANIILLKQTIDPQVLYKQRLLLCYMAEYAPETCQKLIDGLQNILDDIADQYYGQTGDESAFLSGDEEEHESGIQQLRELASAIQQRLEEDQK